MKKAIVKVTHLRGYATPTARMELRAGAKGTGRLLWSCQFWPDSSRSVEQADEWLAAEIERHDVEVIES